MDACGASDSCLDQSFCYFVRGNHPIVAGENRPQRMKNPDGSRLPRTMWLSRAEDSRWAQQREGWEDDRDESLFNLPFYSHIEGPCLWIRADRGVKGKALRAVLAQQRGHRQRVIDIYFAKGLMGTCLAHGCAQSADASIHLP